MTSIIRNRAQRSALLADLFMLAMLTTVAAILTAAMILQFRGGEIPCPLCLLQRVAMFGVCFGVILQLRGGASARNEGISMIFALFLLVVSARQTLLDIYPRPGHEYIGSAIFGIHMPVWSVIIATCILIAFAIKLAVLGDTSRDEDCPPIVTHSASIMSGYVIVLSAVNFIAVIVQCGLDACHTMGYRLLS